MMIREHPLHVQALVYQSTALLMKKIRTLVGHFLMQASHLRPRFLTIPGQLALKADHTCTHRRCSVSTCRKVVVLRRN
jgi:hypothetical protein